MRHPPTNPLKIQQRLHLHKGRGVVKMFYISGKLLKAIQNYQGSLETAKKGPKTTDLRIFLSSLRLGLHQRRLKRSGLGYGNNGLGAQTIRSQPLVVLPRLLWNKLNSPDMISKINQTSKDIKKLPKAVSNEYP